MLTKKSFVSGAGVHICAEECLLGNLNKKVKLVSVAKSVRKQKKPRGKASELEPPHLTVTTPSANHGLYSLNSKSSSKIQDYGCPQDSLSEQKRMRSCRYLENRVLSKKLKDQVVRYVFLQPNLEVE